MLLNHPCIRYSFSKVPCEEFTVTYITSCWSQTSPLPAGALPLLLPLTLTVLRAAVAVQGIDRRERLRRLAMETIDLAKDPYYMRNHLGQVSTSHNPNCCCGQQSVCILQPAVDADGRSASCGAAAQQTCVQQQSGL